MLRIDGSKFDPIQPSITVSFQNFAIEDNSGVRTLRYNAGLSGNTLLHNCDSITSNGTWVVDDDSTNLTIDTLNYISGNGSLNFDTDGSSTTASLYNTTISNVDLSNLENP